MKEMTESGVISDNAFYRSETLNVLEIPEEIISIGKFAFARSSLTSVVIPEGVTSIDYAAFYHCDDLKEVVIPDSVTYIGIKAFEHTAWLEDWYENGEGNYLIVGDGILLGYRGEPEDYVKPANVKLVACDVPK